MALRASLQSVDPCDPTVRRTNRSPKLRCQADWAIEDNEYSKKMKTEWGLEREEIAQSLEATVDEHEGRLVRYARLSGRRMRDLTSGW